MGAFNPGQDLAAPNNWWGPKGADATIFDAADEPGIGKVLFTPEASARF